MSNNVNTNKVNSIVDNELEFNSSNGLDNNPINDTLPIATIRLRDIKSL